MLTVGTPWATNPDSTSTYAIEVYSYLANPPTGEGQEWDPLTGRTRIGSYTFEVVDAPVVPGSTVRAVNQFLVDTNSLQQFVGHRAYGEWCTDGVSWNNTIVAGYITSARLVTAQRWTFMIGEGRWNDDNRIIFDYVTDRFNQVPYLLGNPKRSIYSFISDDAWAFSVSRVDFLSTNNPDVPNPPIVTLQYLYGKNYVRGDTDSTDGNAISDFTRTRVNALAATERKGTPVGAPYVDIYPGITVRFSTPGIAGTPTGLFIANMTPVGVPIGGSPSGGPNITNEGVFLNPINSSGKDVFQVLWQGGVSVAGSSAIGLPVPSVGDIFLVHAYRNTIGGDNALIIRDNAVNVATALFDDAGIKYDAASATTVKNAIGASNLNTVLRIDGQRTLGEFVGLLGLAFGFGYRHYNGQRTFFVTARGSSLPSNSININQLRRTDPVIFTIDDSTIRNVVRASWVNLLAWRPGGGTPQPPPEGLIAQTVQSPQYYVAPNGVQQTLNSTQDWNQYGRAEVSIALPGTNAFNLTGDSRNLGDLWAQGVAARLFQWFGRGGAYTELACTPDVANAPGFLVGDEILLQLPQLPNNLQRGGTRVVRIMRRTEAAEGPTLKCLDMGANAQIGTTPQFQLTHAVSDQRKFVNVKILNAAALNSGLFNLRVEAAVNTPGSLPLTNGNTVTIFGGGNIPAAFTLGFDDGSQVWVRMRCEQALNGPSNWTAWQAIQLAPIVPPTAIQFSVPNASFPTQVQVSWTNGTTDIPVFVAIRKNADDPNSARIVQTLSPGSIQTAPPLSLLANTKYVVEVWYQEINGYNGSSQHLVGNYTTGNAPSMAAPSSPHAFMIPSTMSPEGSGAAGTGQGSSVAGDGTKLNTYSNHPFAVATVGLQVVAAAGPPNLVAFEMAVETSPGSGVPGVYNQFKVVKSAGTADFTQAAIMVQLADNLNRWLRARMVQVDDAGNVAYQSAYCAAVEILPSAISIQPPILSPAAGGTGLPGAYTVGDLLTAASAVALTTINDVAVGSVLVSGGVGTQPSWSNSPTIAGSGSNVLRINQANLPWVYYTDGTTLSSNSLPITAVFGVGSVLSRNLTGASAGYSNGFFYAEQTAAAGSSNPAENCQALNIYSRGNFSSGTFHHIVALGANATMENTGTVDRTITLAALNTTMAGTVTWAASTENALVVTGGSVVSGVGTWVRVPNMSGGSMTTFYGLYIEALPSGGANQPATAYSIYTVGAGQVSIGDFALFRSGGVQISGSTGLGVGIAPSTSRVLRLSSDRTVADAIEIRDANASPYGNWDIGIGAGTNIDALNFYSETDSAVRFSIRTNGEVDVTSGPLIVGTDPGSSAIGRFGGDIAATRGLFSGTIGALSAQNDNVGFRVFGAMPGTASSQTGLYANPTINFNGGNQTNGYGISGSVTTPAQAHTLTNAYAGYLYAVTAGAGSTITNAYGLYIESQTAGGTNYSIWTAGTAASVFGGPASVATGSAPGGDTALVTGFNGAVGNNSYSCRALPTFSSAVTGTGAAFNAQVGTAASAFTMNLGIGFLIFDGSKGAGSTITTLYGLYVNSQTAGGTNYAIYTNSGAVRFGDNVTATGALAVGSASLGSTGSINTSGTVGILSGQSDSVGLRVFGTIPGSASAQTGIASLPTVNSNATLNGYGFFGSVTTAASSFTLASAYGLYIDDATKGSGSTITTQYGVYVNSQTKGGTNYSIYTNTGPGRFGDSVNFVNVIGVLGDGVANNSVAVRVLGSIPGTLSSQSGLYVNPTINFNGGNQTNGYGLSGTVTTPAQAHTLTNAYAGYLYAVAAGAGSTITNAYGLYVESQTAGGTSNYAIYTNGGVVKFGDRFEMYGTVTTTSMCNITGTIQASGGFAIGYEMAGTLSAQANLDNLVALYVSPSWTLNSKTGTSGVGLWLRQITAATSSNNGIIIDAVSGGTSFNRAMFLYTPTGTGAVIIDTQVGAQLTTAGVWTNAPSYRHLKYDIEPLAGRAVAALRDLEPVSFRRRANNRRDIHFIMEDYRATMEHHRLVDFDVDGIADVHLATLAVAGWQDHDKRIRELEEENRRLRDQIATLAK